MDGQSRIFLKNPGVTLAHGIDQHLKRLTPLHFRRKTVWSRDFYVVDIVDYFLVDGKQLGEIFAARFLGATFRRSTYYDNKKRWLAASQLIKDNALEAGTLPLASGQSSPRKYPPCGRRRE